MMDILIVTREFGKAMLQPKALTPSGLFISQAHREEI